MFENACFFTSLVLQGDVKCLDLCQFERIQSGNYTALSMQYSLINPQKEAATLLFVASGVNHAVSTEQKESYRVSAIQNLHSFDPFADASKDDDLLPAGTEDYIHIRIQQRNGRKTLTTVQGMADDYDKKKLVKVFRKKFACNGTVIEHPEYGEVIQLQGGQRKNICQFLVEIGLAKDDQLRVHAF
ncbi:eukaryotic translation initiation factor 1-like [Vulpes lagopus]|uniref:eukaryotic translation initiation factor 1-like n=1 Tax=Vulpes lagopus TaxID=494514 RepID=UPI001BC94F51|nr:eukaryotic translation initiation factor 1-like [Vulpes lagopus]